MTHEFAENYDVIVVGAGHAGVEASLAAARMGCKTMLATINLEMLSFMPCNPATVSYTHLRAHETDL